MQEQAKLTLGDFIDEVSGHIQLTQGKLVMVSVIQYIQQIRVERVDIIHLGKIIQYLCIARKFQVSSL